MEMKQRITETAIAALNGLTGLGFLGAISLVMFVERLKHRDEE